MQKYFGMIISNIPAMICYTFAGILAFNSLGGWGWFLLVGLFITHTFSKAKEKE